WRKTGLVSARHAPLERDSRMNTPRPRLLLTAFTLLLWSSGSLEPFGSAVATMNPPAESEADPGEDFAVPPGDPWAAPQPQQRGSRTDAFSLVLKARITPHWFGDHTRFWYRNDLHDGAKEFILVDAA